MSLDFLTCVHSAGGPWGPTAPIFTAQFNQVRLPKLIPGQRCCSWKMKRSHSHRRDNHRRHFAMSRTVSGWTNFGRRPGSRRCGGGRSRAHLRGLRSGLLVAQTCSGPTDLRSFGIAHNLLRRRTPMRVSTRQSRAICPLNPPRLSAQAKTLGITEKRKQNPKLVYSRLVAVDNTGNSTTGLRVRLLGWLVFEVDRGERDRCEFRNRLRAGGCINPCSCATAQPAFDGLLTDVAA